jgi:hypothetical protein
VEPKPSQAARAFAEALLTHADALDSTDLNDIVDAIPAITAAARRLGDLLEERGWGNHILYDWPGPDEEDEYGEDDLTPEDDQADDDDADDDEGSVGTAPLAGPRISYQARFDFVIVDEQALRARVEARSRQEGPDADPEEETQHYGGSLSLLLYLDNPTFRDYESAGVEMVYGNEVIRPVERTLDQFSDEIQEDHFPVG